MIALPVPRLEFGPTASAAAGHAAHGGALLALLFLPVALMSVLILIDLGARLRWAPALKFVTAFAVRGTTAKLICLLMLMVAAIHVGLIPAHWQADPLRGLAFGAEAVLLVGLSGWAVLGTGWQPATAALMVVNLLGYWYYVGSGLERLDQIGLFTKLVEAACLALLAAEAFARIRARSPRPRWRHSTSS